MIPARRRIALKFARALARISGIRLEDPSPTLTKFVLIANQRTGSTWIIDLLNSHPHITAYSELFHGANYGRPKVGGQRDILVWNSYAASHGSPRGRLDRMRLFFRYLDEEVYRKDDNRQAAGFKLMYDQAACEFYVLAYLKVRQAAVIHLIRRNHLDCVLSEEAATNRSVAHAEKGAQLTSIQLELDTHTLFARLETRSQAVRQTRDFYSQLGIPYLEIYYEDLASDSSRLNEVLQFLKVEPANCPLNSDFQKLNPKDHRQLIANYDEVHELLKGTEFFGLLR